MRTEDLFELWDEYRQDPEVRQNSNPPLGVVFSFEGFWLWLLKKRNEN